LAKVTSPRHRYPLDHCDTQSVHLVNLTTLTDSIYQQSFSKGLILLHHTLLPLKLRHLFSIIMNNMANHLAPTLPHANGPKNIIISDYALPRFYIVRPDKSFVPLIPADEIDPMWRIKGIPAQLSPELIQQWNMARCGDEVDPQRHTYQLEQIYVEGSDEESYQTSVNTGMSLQSPDTASTIPQGKNMGNMEEAYTINRHVSGDDIHHGHGRGEQLSQAQQQTQVCRYLSVSCLNRIHVL